MNFKINYKDKESAARNGIISTDHGNIETPIFMPVGTAGTVKGVHFHELENIGAEIILGNTYHLYLRPGIDVIKKAGGLHKFNGWKHPILTDSGGYQVFSLADNRKLSENGAEFKSHIDGSKHLFTPENVVDIQRAIGADIIMAFDECTPYPCDYNYAKNSMNLTHKWLERGYNYFKTTHDLYGFKQAFFPIVQGSVFNDLRKQSAEYISSIGAEGNAIGGLSVGEPAKDMYKMIEIVNSILPKDKPRYLMGVGTPENIIEAVSRGVDMFDCVMPTRNGRNGMLFTWNGTINIKNKKWQYDFSPIDENGLSYVDVSYSKAYLRHLIISGELLGAQIASIHNLGFYVNLIKTIREKIKEGCFTSWKNNVVENLSKRI
ncbi:MAG TPA: tRNA guanosine(34) transglycosylase Tgt [Bacteroidales bacterium]|jgi:queuine tRNA-ribosyltransferase|nr:tRNA guanosine(34) transglycosylase Tgt [Bacteroidales bacterium]MDD4236024.1 tRNA guanosine(34) transglycosylase Tgt [Bacteroidales bacterium]MDY0160467.1 tRNA guanosine(34) transglycosylase Tgt [Bacteroidales bacterium]HXK82178.1 tRNA guanosine(34) transglycosylase Tgt [Bacteroidales bacterium]